MRKGTFLLVTVFFILYSSFTFGQKNVIEVLGGFDGANPQSQDSIIQEATNRFRIKPFNEEGSNNSYYYRMETKVINHSKNDKDIELIVEWPVGRRDTYYYGDMGNWRWTYANRDGRTERINVPVPPGITYVGFYPKYSYEYFTNFMNNLKPSQDLEKWVEGKSFYGRDIWGVKITSPKVSDSKKRNIFITARNHPYESSGSFIAEEMIKYLLSDDPKAEELKQKNVIYFIPMMNPDGVVLGCNQRTRPNGVNISFGADTDEPEVKTLLNLVGKVKPVLWADIHSWPHRGDDGMWCTHKWVADGLLSKIPNKTFQDYVWDVSFVKERDTAENHLWQWLIRTYDSGGVSLSISWHRRSEQEIREIGVHLINAISEVVNEKN